MGGYLPLSDYFSYRSVRVVGEKHDHTATDAFWERALGHESSRFPEIKRLLFAGCVLKRPMMQFAAGTKFDEIWMNECGVVHFFIRDARFPHAVGPSGFSYYGTWKLRISFGDGLVLDASEMFRIATCCECVVQNDGFVLRGCTAQRDFGSLKKDEGFRSIHFDVVHSSISATMSHNNGSFGGKLSLRIALRPEDISKSFLAQALRESDISPSEHNDLVKRRYDVEMPPEMRENGDAKEKDEEEEEEERKTLSLRSRTIVDKTPEKSSVDKQISSTTQKKRKINGKD